MFDPSKLPCLAVSQDAILRPLKALMTTLPFNELRRLVSTLLPSMNLGVWLHGVNSHWSCSRRLGYSVVGVATDPKG